VGKTVLLQEYAERAKEAGWVTAVEELGAGHNTDGGIQTLISSLAERAKHEVSRFERVRKAVGTFLKSVRKLSVEWNDVTFSVDPGAAGKSIARELLEVSRFAVSRGRSGVVLLLDEAQSIRDEKDRTGDHPLSLLIAAIVALQKQEVPIGLVLCGLPTLTGNLLKAKSYTERMFRGEEIGSLESDEARQALVEPLKGGPIAADRALVTRVVEEVEGYPYFVQLWGAELWDAAQEADSETMTIPLLKATQQTIYHRLDHDFYEPRVATLTPAEQDLLLSTAHSDSYPPLLVAEINEMSQKTPGNINVLLGRLVESGVLYRIRKGQYEYTAPKFRQYLIRRIGRHRA
jgi:hypothetical protein